MLLVGSANAAIGLPAGMEVLRGGGGALDAVVAAIEPVEANPDDHSVGYSGLPNLLGEVELDASLMDGRTLATGAVGALRGYQHAIRLGRFVMENLPHVLIAGEGAARLAREAGLPATELLTSEAEQIWRQRLGAAGEPSERDGYYARMRELARAVTSDPELADAHGTVNVIARDAAGNIACGVSTSGWAWKYPGRLGDSPIVGAGNYADNRWGAAACTGRGEMAQRCCTAHTVVTMMRCGHNLDAALELAMADLIALDDPFAGEINIVAIDHEGRHSAASTAAGKTYVVLRGDGQGVETIARRHVPFPGATTSA